MSMKPRDFSRVPQSTADLVQRAPRLRKSPYILLRDKLGPLFKDQDFAPLFESPRGRPAEAPALLMLVLILQFIEDLDDRAAAFAVISRVDWKYLLGLAWEDPGFDASVLSEFRSRLAESELLSLFFERVLEIAEAEGLLKKRGRQRTDSTHVVGHVRELNRLECVARTMQAALNSLATLAPRWLQSWVPLEWYERYGQRMDNYCLPRSQTERRELAETIGYDGLLLLEMCQALEAPRYLCEVEAVLILQQVWQQQYALEEEPLRWRRRSELPPQAELICSPYEPEARYSTKRETSWLGYKVHVTETCDPDQPRLITHVETTPATTSDQEVLPEIHAELERRGRLPGEHLVDTGYVSAHTLVSSAHDYEVEVVGPMLPDVSWQARAEEGYDRSQFRIDWDAQVVTCPQGVLSTCWAPSQHPDYEEPVIHVRFPRAACQACAARERCTRARKDGRTLTFLSLDAHEAQEARRQEQRTAPFWERYKARSGVEGTLSLGVRAFGLRRARYRGLAKTHLQHLLTATAINLMRMAEWWSGQQPKGTRVSRFAALAPA